MVLAMMMVVMFTSVVVTVLELTARYVGGQQVEEGANGLLIDHEQIQAGFDQLAEVLSQPGINLNETSGSPAIAHPLGSDPDEACAPLGKDPMVHWGLPGPKPLFPPDYRLCIWSTSLSEDEASNKPGIYVLQALPKVSGAASLPVRRLICRPRPFC